MGNSKLTNELTEAISIDGGIKINFADGSDEQLRKFADWGTSQDAEKSPVLMVRCFNKQSIADLVAKAKRYDEAVGLGGVIVAVPESKDGGGVTTQAHAAARNDIQSAFPQKPFLLVTHDRDSFDIQNIALAILLHEMKKHGVTSDVPLWCHSYAPNVTDEQLANVAAAMNIAPYLLSVRTQYENLELPDGIMDSITAIKENVAHLPEQFPTDRIHDWKQLFRSTNMVWSVQDAKSVGGFNRLFGGEKFVVKDLPDSVRPDGFDQCTISGAGGEEDTDLVMRLSQDDAVKPTLEKVLDEPVIQYFDPDVRPDRKEKFERAWSLGPHPAHYFMFPQIATKPEHKAALAIQKKMQGHVPEDWRGVRFV